MTLVLHIITGLGTGGAELSLATLARALQERGLPQHVVSLSEEGRYGEELKRAGIAVGALNLSSPMQAPAGVLKLSNLVRRLKPAVIQGWMYHGNLMAALVDRLVPGRASRRLLWNLRASNMDSVRYARVVRWGAMLSQWPDVIVSNSEAGEAFHREQGYQPRLSKVIANGIDTQKFKPDVAMRDALRAEFGIARDATVVVHAARVDAMKDHPTCLAALAAAPGVLGILFGAGTDSLPLPPNVRALGMRRDVERLYAMADIVISTSAFGEGFSNAIAEGMSSGLVPVATDVGDARPIVGETGHVVAPRDVRSLASAIRETAALTPAERTALGRRARARIEEKFSLQRSVDAYEHLYCAVTKKRPLGRAA
ncbi:MAG: glycosyltransferase [Xanthobacteraceae bacterium]|nr:glycosyltransferase [Xanthobacteraceae bacterium]